VTDPVLIGFVTPLAAFAAVVSSFVLAPSWLPPSAPAIVVSAFTPIFLTADAVSLVMLGPGALSIDARLFGRREVIIPHEN
jgi:uncharacterized membrane protein YphA (DoxX/SURF4 family)